MNGAVVNGLTIHRGHRRDHLACHLATMCSTRLFEPGAPVSTLWSIGEVY
jgi:hypothetical protein